MTKDSRRNNALKRRESFTAEEIPLTEDTTCGFGPVRGKFLQKFATKNCAIIFYGCLCLCQLSTWSYFNGTISTMEKRFKIPSRVTGMITSGLDISGLLTSVVLSYWAGGGHRPRWLALAGMTMLTQMCLTTLPHLIYGPGEDALALTKEYREKGTYADINNTEKHEGKGLCKGGDICVEDVGSIIQPILLFIGQFFSGIGGSLAYTIGLSYIDDNIEKSESPAFISIAFFIRMMGATLGFSLASVCLGVYIAPTTTPLITPQDPRWMGAWWLGWVILTIAAIMVTIPISLLPKVLPEVAAKKALSNDEAQVESKHTEKPSFLGMVSAIKRLCQNKLFIYNNVATMFYCVGEEPYWVYMAKYIETQYAQTASAANIVTGTIGLGSVAVGMLFAGMAISKFQPSARTLALCNVVIGFISVFGAISYVFIDCDEIKFRNNDFDISNRINITRDCNEDCGCEFVPYTPVCAENGETLLSPCHAGCTKEINKNGVKMYSECACVEGGSVPATVKAGICTADCTKPFYIFLAVTSFLKFAKAAGLASNFLVGIRCIDEEDKSLSMGITGTLLSVVFIPAPVLYGYILDTTCLVWGKTCTGHGNCWVYDRKKLAYALNLVTACFLAIGTFFDFKVWQKSKFLKIFD